jgi:hypothetical protein
MIPYYYVFHEDEEGGADNGISEGGEDEEYSAE